VVRVIENSTDRTTVIQYFGFEGEWLVLERVFINNVS